MKEAKFLYLYTLFISNMVRIAIIFFFTFFLFTGNQSFAQWTAQTTIHYTATGIKDGTGNVLKAGDYAWDEGENKTIAAADGFAVVGANLAGLVGNLVVTAITSPGQHSPSSADFKNFIAAADDGSFKYTHNGDEIISTPVQFFVTLGDDDAGGANADLNITVKIDLVAVNDTPQALTDSEAVNEGGVVNGNIRDPKWFLDPDHMGVVDGVANRFTGTVAFSVAPGALTWGTLNSFNATTGAFQYTANSNIPGGDPKSETWTFTLNDGGGGGDQQGTININIANSLPNPGPDEFWINVVVFKNRLNRKFTNFWSRKT